MYVIRCTCHAVLCLLQSAVGWEYQTELSKHGSQTDAAKGFGGRYGVQTDRQDEVNLDVKNVLHVHVVCLYMYMYRPRVLHN